MQSPIDPIFKLLHDRIQELFPYGLENIWLRFDGDDYYHIATVLGYDRDLFDRIIDFKFSHGRGIGYATIGKKLNQITL